MRNRTDRMDLTDPAALSESLPARSSTPSDHEKSHTAGPEMPADAQHDLLQQLRTANEHLVVATMKAQAMQERAEAAHRRQNEFLAMLAHELRNPLAPISHAAAMLEKAAGTQPVVSKIHAIISRQVGHMSRLLDDLLDASRISTGKVSLQKHIVAFSEIVSRAAEVSQPFIDRRHQRLSILLPNDPVMLEGDLERLAQVFSNLLINASKFNSDHGTITLGARIDQETIVVSVKDNGVGIAPDVLPHVFDLFMQAERSLDRSEGGLGIGLTVVQSLVESHGGTITAMSDGPDMGSEFVVRLPILPAVTSEVAQTAQRSTSAHACRILLVEDNIDASETLKMLLEFDNHRVDCAFDGHGGETLAADGGYDVIICDIGLPGLSGLEFVRRVRKHDPSPRPYMIAMSGYGQPDDQAKALDAGFDTYLVKPVGGNLLLETIASHLLSQQ